MESLAEFGGKLGTRYYSVAVRRLSSRLLHLKTDEDVEFNKCGWFVKALSHNQDLCPYDHERP